MKDLQTKYALPQSYIDLIKSLEGKTVDIEYEYTYPDGDTTEYDGNFYNIQQLKEGNKYYSQPFYKRFENAKEEFEGRFEEKDDFDLDTLSRSFCFGSMDEGRLIFHPDNHSVYIIYLDGFLRKLEDSFDLFIAKSNIEE